MIKPRLLLFLLFAPIGSLGAAGNPVSLAEEMSSQVFAEAGLDKLSADELAVLEMWLGARFQGLKSQETVPQETAEEQFGRETVLRTQGMAASAEERGPDVIQSRILGAFRGWRGNQTRFTLENGQVWQQTRSGRLSVNLENPVVTIRRGAVGGYLLSVEGYSKTVRVKRIR